MDDIDCKILGLLQDDASRSISEIASSVHLSTTPCWKRIRRLEKDGVIRKRVALSSFWAVGLCTFRCQHPVAHYSPENAREVQEQDFQPQLVAVSTLHGDCTVVLCVWRYAVARRYDVDFVISLSCFILFGILLTC